MEYKKLKLEDLINKAGEKKGDKYVEIYIKRLDANRVVFQYPTSSVRMTKEIINYISNSNAELVLFIHDISSLQEDGNTISEYEIRLLCWH